LLYRKEVYNRIASKGRQHQYWQSVKMGANKAAKDYNVRITIEGPEGDAALVLAACNSDAVISST